MNCTSTPPVPEQELHHGLAPEQFKISPLDRDEMVTSLLQHLPPQHAGLWTVSLEPSVILSTSQTGRHFPGSYQEQDLEVEFPRPDLMIMTHIVPQGRGCTRGSEFIVPSSMQEEPDRVASGRAYTFRGAECRQSL